MGRLGLQGEREGGRGARAPQACQERSSEFCRREQGPQCEGRGREAWRGSWNLWRPLSARPSGSEVPSRCAWASRGSPGCGRTERQPPAPGGCGRLPPPHPRRRRPRSPASPHVSSSRGSQREQFNWQNFGLRTDVVPPCLEAGSLGAGEGAGRST